MAGCFDMKGSFNVLFLIFAFCLLFCRTALGSVAQLKEGNRFFKNGQYDKAIKSYNDGLIDSPHSSILHFNAGDAAYQSGDFAKAEKSFEEASQSGIPLLKAAAHYNRGNALFRQGRWADAADAYKESLRVNPRDDDAKYNLGVALRAQTNPPPGPPPKSGQGSPKKESKGGGQNKQGADQSQGAAPKPGQMSREDAERLLAAAGAGEQKKSNQKFSKTDVPHPEEDW
jgi:Ca-activated chloride channel homolog